MFFAGMPCLLINVCVWLPCICYSWGSDNDYLLSQAGEQRLKTRYGWKKERADGTVSGSAEWSIPSSITACVHDTHTQETHTVISLLKKWLRFLVSVKVNLVENATSLHNSYFESEKLHVHSEWNAGPCAGSTLYSNLMDIWACFKNFLWRLFFSLFYHNKQFRKYFLARKSWREYNVCFS